MSLPESARARLLADFSSATNRAQLAAAFRSAVPDETPSVQARRRFLLESLDAAMAQFTAPGGLGQSLVHDDPLARRGRVARGTQHEEELAQLNRAFFEHRLRLAYANELPDHPGGVAQTTGGPGEFPIVDGEPLYYRMFVADSLRPPGLEHLNGPQPFQGLKEPAWAGGPDPYRPSAARYAGMLNVDSPSMAAGDRPWGPGVAHRKPEDVVAEYYGTDSVLSEACYGRGDRPTVLDAVPDSVLATPGSLEVSVKTYGGGRASIDYAAPEDRAAVDRWDVEGLMAGRVGVGFPADREAPPVLRGTYAPGYSTGSDAHPYTFTAGEVPMRDVGLLEARCFDGVPAGHRRRTWRREGIPLWQKAGQRPQLLSGRWQSAVGGPTEVGPDGQITAAGDFEDGLGAGSAEFGGERESFSRRYDMSGLLTPRGRELYGPTHRP